MPPPANEAQIVFLYRRIHPSQWSTQKSQPSRAVFVEGEREGLSLFRADLQSPRGVMEQAIATAKQWLGSSDEAERQRGAKQLAQFGETVEEWLQHGWRVVRLPQSALVERGYLFDEPDADGHLNAFGEHAVYAKALVAIAQEVPAEEFLAP